MCSLALSYPLWLNLLAFGCSAGAIAPLFFKGGWLDALVSCILGFIVGLIVWICGKIVSKRVSSQMCCNEAFKNITSERKLKSLSLL